MEEIKIDNTEYSVGNLIYIKKIDVYEPGPHEENKTSFLYDRNSGNIHLFPKKPGCAKEIAEIIAGKLGVIYNHLREKYKSNKEIRVSYNLRNLKAFEGTQRQEAQDIYRCVRVTKNSITFCITGFRFIKNGDIIDEELCSLQFSAIDNSKSIDFYPHSNKTGEILNRSKGNCYYNPKTSFYASAEKICEEFERFISEYGDSEKMV